MKIVMFSINPVFPDVVTGGASKHLYTVARHLGAQGHDVEILCAKPNDDLGPFTWVEGVRVSPVLPFHLPFPQPYAIGGGDLALIVQKISQALEDADRFYIHDGELLLPDLYSQIPTVISFRDNVYPESVLGSFIGKPDEIICVSPFSAEVIRASVGRFYPGLDHRLHQVNNGIDFDLFKPVPTADLRRRLGISVDAGPILLHPHRPEPGKGLPETIRLAERLVHEKGHKHLKVLVPEWIGSMVSAGESAFYQEMMALMTALGVRDHFHFIPWIAPDEMPTLYSLGDLTLCLGNIVEAFGNVAYESLACGTPSLVARVGVHRTLLPDELIDKVPYGDLDQAVEIADEILRSEKGVNAESLDYLHQELDFDTQVQSYAGLITGAEKRPPLAFSASIPDEQTLYRLALWCDLAGDRIYHDYRGQFEQAGDLVRMFGDGGAVTFSEANIKGITEEIWEAWINKTYIVPEF
ncbi:glycosyltransferase family 4 protein [bacterium]|nr:glycosyltransferase family 4 protein [bacterium]